MKQNEHLCTPRCISKIYQEFYEDIIYMVIEGRHIRMGEYVIAA